MLKKLVLFNFKNHRQAEFNFTKRINCFAGLNGVGKTNILDALYYLSFTKSFLNSSDQLNITKGEEFFSVRGIYDLDGIEENFLCHFDANKGKTFKRNEKAYDKIVNHIGLLPMVIAIPQDINLIFDQSAFRRKFMDSAISQYDNDFLLSLQNYNRALLQRNKMLKDAAKIHKFDANMITLYDNHLITSAKEIFEKRKEFVENFSPSFQKYYSLISTKDEKPELVYQSQLFEQSMEDILLQNFDKDCILSHTSKGVHRDDLLFRIEDMMLKNSGSQGQQKTFLLALKLSQYDFLKTKGLNPILMLDDIFDKLDNQRVAKIVDVISKMNFSQIFITHTSKDEISNIISRISGDFEVFEIK